MATIMLDAGHGGYDSGAVYGDRYEKNDTLSLVLAVGTILENNGVDVLYTRTTDVYQSPNEKAGIANRSDADYFISIHRNSSPDPNTYSGVETLVCAKHQQRAGKDRICKSRDRRKTKSSCPSGD